MAWVAITLAMGATVEKKWLLALSGAGLVISALLLMIIVGILRLSMEHTTPREEPIWIEESLPPSMLKNTPQLSPTVERRCIRRGGVRGKHHRRVRTSCYNPKARGDSGYQTILKAASLLTGPTKVVWLRQEVATMVYEARTKNIMCAGIDMHDPIKQQGMSLAAYVEATKQDQWASAVELAMASHVLNIQIAYVHDKAYRVVGEGKRVKYAIALREEHFTFLKLHKTADMRGKLALARGGMQHEEHRGEEQEQVLGWEVWRSSPGLTAGRGRSLQRCHWYHASSLWA